MSRHPRLVSGIVTAALAAGGVAAVVPAHASPRATAGVGVAHVTTGTVHHPWLGAWRVAVGPGGPVVNAYCIRTGGWFPGSPSWPVGDVAAQRGASATARAAMSYLLWRHGDTTDPITAAGLNVVAYHLSADEMSPGVPYPPPGHLEVSHGAVRARALALYDEGMARRGPWSVQVAAAPAPGDPTRVRATAHLSGPAGSIPGASAIVTVTNGAGSGGYATDGSGNLVVDVTPTDPAAPVRVEVAFAAPAPYGTLHDLEAPARQVVVHGNGVPLLGSAQATLPAGEVTVVKRNTNPAWQDDAGARFELRTGSAAGPVARTVGGAPAVLETDAAGRAGRLRMAPGTYWAVETHAPAGQSIGFAPRALTVAPGATVTLEAENPADATAELVLTKVDADTGEPLAGAHLLVERDHDDTWTFAPVPLGDGASNGDRASGLDPGIVVTAEGPTTVDGLLAGRYRVREVVAPPGYTLPEVREVVVELGVGESLPVDVADVRPHVRTEASTDEAVVGEEIVDTVVVGNVASWNRGEVRVDLFGPFEPDGPLRCDDEHRVAREAWEVVGSGTFESPPFTVAESGRYTFVATWRSLEPGDGSHATHECGLVPETVLVRDRITLRGVKFDAEDPGRRLADGRYRVLVVPDDLPPGLLEDLATRAARHDEGAAPAEEGGGNRVDPVPDVPDGHVLLTHLRTDADGEVALEVWSHARYCFQELEAPAGYVPDPELRCTDGVLAPGRAEAVDLPERPLPPEVAAATELAASVPSAPATVRAAGDVELPTTGRGLVHLLAVVGAVSAAGGALLLAARPRRHRTP